MLSAICFNLDQPIILLSGNWLSKFSVFVCLPCTCSAELLFKFVVFCFFYRYKMVFFIFLIHGVGILMPWNMFITAKSVSPLCKLRPLNSALTPFPFQKKHCFLNVCSTSLLKTLWEKEKFLITSNFFFYHSVLWPFGEFSATFIKF